MTATPPVFLHPLADRNGSPSALLLDATRLPAGLGEAPVKILEELADGDAGSGGAEAEVEGHVLPEVLGHEHMPAQGLLGAEDQ